jgi:hypothetical protein
MCTTAKSMAFMLSFSPFQCAQQNPPFNFYAKFPPLFNVHKKLPLSMCINIRFVGFFLLLSPFDNNDKERLCIFSPWEEGPLESCAKTCSWTLYMHKTTLKQNTIENHCKLLLCASPQKKTYFYD